MNEEIKTKETVDCIPYKQFVGELLDPAVLVQQVALDCPTFPFSHFPSLARRALAFAGSLSKKGEKREMHRRDDLRLLSTNLGIFLGFLTFFCNSYFIVHVEASIHEYFNEAFIPKLNSSFFHGGSEGLYASKVRDSTGGNSTEAASSSSSSKGKSFIRFESVTFQRTKEAASQHHYMQQKTGLVEAIILEIQDRDRIGGSYLNSDEICCTPELAKISSCKVGEVIIHPNLENPEWPKRIQTFFEGNTDEAKMITQAVEIESTGMYYLYFMFCDPTLKGTTITGRTVWRNPEGYLPGKMAPLMTFYGFMSLAYLVLGLIWFLQFGRFWKDILQLHYHITLVIALGMCEMALWYFEYANFNSTGSRPMGITWWAVTFSAIKKTVSRLLLLVVSMGYGVVRPTLGGITSRVAILGIVYFAATEALELVEHLGNINDFSGKAKLFLVLPVAILDACFILWIFSSLSQTLEKLQMRRSAAKLELYRKFTNALALSVLLSVAWIGYEVQRQKKTNAQYAYSEEMGDEFDEEGISLTGSVAKATVDMVSKLDRKERKTTSTSDHVFGLGEAEEDKRL
ncbi:Transmembrane protein 87A [Asimina triloba]